MTVKEFRAYQMLALKGLVPPALCVEDEDHGYLYANLSEDGRLFLHCLACRYKIYPGINLSDKIVSAVKELGDSLE